MTFTDQTFGGVRTVVAQTLNIESRTDTLRPTTELSGLPEFDSMAVLDVMLALESHFGITIEDDEVSGELFETLGTLATFVQTKLS